MFKLSTGVLVSILLLSVCSISKCTSHETDSPMPMWMYQCIVGQNCVRSLLPLSDWNSSTVYQTLDLCRSMCGQFAGLWPRPTFVQVDDRAILIHPLHVSYDVISSATPEVKNILLKMTQLTTDNLLAECNGVVTDTGVTPVNVFIEVKAADVYLTWDTNEEYTLKVDKSANGLDVVITADNVFGARHGLETFSQLVSPTKPDYSNENSCGLKITESAQIKDSPKFPHRGFLLDTARNFIPMSDIKRMIVGMAAVKMNVFHWHVTDTHSFPLESLRVPQMTRFGAYSPSQIYRVNDVRELIEFALIRGVRVVIEIDAPAHAGNGWQWGKDFGFGDLAVCVNSQPWRQMCIQPPCGQLNPINNAVYRILRDIYHDIAKMSVAPVLLHMGGDEVFFQCWNTSQEITSYMRDKGIELNAEGFIRLWAEFHSKTLQIWDEELRALGTETEQPVLLWSSELTKPDRIQKYLSKSRYVIEVFEPVENTRLYDLIELGYRVISSPKNVWYLDHGFWGQTGYSNWRRMYSHILPQNQLALGGEVAMWTEYVDEQGLDARVWPRAAAVAERLWSNPETTSQAATPRLERLRNRLIARGLRPDVLSPGWCQQNDNKCG